MADTSTILRGFNNHLFEFLDDIISIFPENSDLKTAKTFFEFTKKGNVTILIKMWHEFVYKPYGVLLEQGELEHFITKDYSKSYFTEKLKVTDPNNWHLESHRMGIDAHSLSFDATPSAAYILSNTRIAKQQLALAGYRLAALLNALLI